MQLAEYALRGRRAADVAHADEKDAEVTIGRHLSARASGPRLAADLPAYPRWDPAFPGLRPPRSPGRATGLAAVPTSPTAPVLQAPSGEPLQGSHPVAVDS